MNLFNKPTPVTPPITPPTPPHPAPAKPRKKRNRALERLRRKITLFQQGLYQEAYTLHDTADHLREDADPDARFDRRIPTTSARRLKAHEIERIADLMWRLLDR